MDVANVWYNLFSDVQSTKLWLDEFSPHNFLSTLKYISVDTFKDAVILGANIMLTTFDVEFVFDIGQELI